MERSMVIVKAGTLYRLSDVLRIWKKEWIVIYLNGLMKIFKSQDKYTSDRQFDLTVECQRILNSNECSHSSPEHKSKECIFGFKTPDGNNYFCADSEDDALAWKMVIEQYIGVLPSPSVTRRPPRPNSNPTYSDTPHYNGHGGYYYQTPYPYTQPVINGNQGQMVVPQTVIQHPDGSQTVYVNNNQTIPYCHHHGCSINNCYRCHHDCYDGSGAALGFAAGALMFTPFLWGPLLWL